MSKDQVSNKSILDEHGRIAAARHVLALVNFVAILAGTAITLFFMGKRGAPDSVSALLWVLLAVNFVQSAICITDLVTKKAFGIYLGWLPFVSYGVGAVWLALLIGEVVAGAAELGALRTDLVAIAVIQFVVALIAYLVWPMLDRKAIDAMIRPSVRDDDKKRKARSKTYTVGYICVCAAVIVLQGAALLAYKLPPRPYDLFASSRAVKYELTEDGSGYVVASVYRGTSHELNIPAEYNGLPVVGIARGALVEDGLLDKYKVSEITFGTPVKTDSGDYAYESNLQYIEGGAISNDKISELTLPASVTRVGEGAVKSKSLKTLAYKAAADFSISSYDCSALNEIIMEGESVGNIVSLDGMSHDVTIRVEKDIYNRFRQNNMEYIHSFVPTIGEDEFCVDFYTDSDYYIESIFEKKGNAVTLGVNDLKNNKISGVSPVVDTLAYIRDPHELDTDGVKGNSAFRGWYYNDAFTEECIFTENTQVRFTENTTLYAKWIDEYTGAFDWGTFTPDGATTELHWTSEDVVKFPIVADRIGYADGVKWSVAGSDSYLTDSSTLNKSVTLKGTWILDKPSIDIEPNKRNNEDGFIVSQSKNEIQFTYDENRSLRLSAAYSHPLGGTLYEFSWSKDGASLNNTTESASARNVADGGTYTLNVRALSPFGETSVAATSVTVDIARKPLGIANALTMADKTSEYNNGMQTIDVTGELPANSKIKTRYEYKDANGAVLSDGGVRNAGEYTVTAYYEKDNAADQANYATESLQAKLVITRKPVTVSEWIKHDWAGASSGFTTVYNGRSQYLTATLDGVLLGDGVQIRYNNNEKTEAGSYTAEATEIYGKDAANYSFVGASQAWTIDKKVITVSRWDKDNAFTDNTATYDGNEHNVYAVIAGVENGEVLSFTYANSGVNVTSATVAGNYTAKIVGITGSTASNYRFDTASAAASFDWAISPRALTLNLTSIGSDTYDGSNNHGITATVGNIVPSDLNKFEDDFFNINISSGVTKRAGTAGYGNYSIDFTSVNADSYSVGMALRTSAQNALLNNYTMTAQNKSYTVKPKAVTVTCDERKTYNGKEQSLYVYVDGIVSSDISKVSLDHFTAAGATSGGKSGDTFRIEYKGKAAGAYDVSVSSFGNTNYKLTPFEGTVTIMRKSLTAMWWIDGTNLNATSVTYNGQTHSFTATPSGVCGGDTVEFTITGDTTGKDVTKNGYKVTAALDSKYTDYSFGGAGQTFYVQPYTINLNWIFKNTTYTNTALIPQFTYDGNTVTATPSFSVFGNDEVGLTYIEGSTLSASNASSAGYLVSVSGLSGADSGNYALGSTNKQFTWKINPKTITIDWGEMTGKVYNGKNQYPAFTLSDLYSVKTGATVTLSTSSSTFTDKRIHVSLTGGETVYNLDDLENGCSVKADTYRVSIVGISDDNYKIDLANTALYTIAKKTLSLTGVWNYTDGTTGGVYGGQELVYNKTGYTFATAIADGSICGDDDVSLVYSANIKTNVGTTNATVASLSGTDASNYALPANTAVTVCSCTIKARSVTITDWNGLTKTYNGTAQTVSVRTADGLCNGDSVGTLRLTYTNNSGTDAASYTATAVCGNGNYNISNPTCDWKINPAPVALKWSATSFTYNGATQTPTAAYTLNGVTVRATAYSGDITARNAQNGYTVTVTALDNKNFTLTGGSGLSCEFNIAKRIVEISWDTINVVYDGEYYSATANIVNKCAGDGVTLSHKVTQNGNYRPSTVADAGNYNAIVYDDDNLIGPARANYTVVGATNTVKENAVVITKQPALLSWLVDGGAYRQELIFDGNAHTLSAVATGYYDNKTIALDSYSATITNVGSVYLEISEINNNYELLTSHNSTMSLSIRSKSVSAAWKLDGVAVAGSSATIPYDGNLHTLTAEVMGTVTDVSIVYNGGTHTYLHAADSIECVASLSDGNNYVLNNGTFALSITKLKANIVWKDNEQPIDGQSKTIEFDGNTHKLKAEVTGLLDCDADDYSLSYDGSSTNGVYKVGEYYWTVRVNNNDYYFDAKEQRVALTITPKPVTVSWSGIGTFIYDGTTRNVVATAKDSNGYAVNNALTVAGTFSVKAVGTYEYAAALNDSLGANYKFVGNTTELTATLVIKPRVVALSWDNASVEYDGTVKSLGAVITNVCGGDTVDLTYSVTKDGANVSEVKNAGAYVYTVTGISNANYTLAGADADSLTRTLTITKKEVRLESTVTTVYLSEGVTVAEAMEVIDRTLFISRMDGLDYKITYVIISQKSQAEYTNPDWVMQNQYYDVKVKGVEGIDDINYSITYHFPSLIIQVG